MRQRMPMTLQDLQTGKNEIERRCSLSKRESFMITILWRNKPNIVKKNQEKKNGEMWRPVKNIEKKQSKVICNFL